MMMRLIIPLLLLVLSGCASVTGYHFEPDSTNDAKALISYSVDDFEGDSWLRTEPVVNMDHANAVYHLRAHYGRDNALTSIQVYVNFRTSNWYFFNDAVMKGENVRFIPIDREVVSGGYVHEDFAVEIDLDTLKRMAAKDTLIKLKGKRGEYVFSTNKYLSSAFLAELENRNI